MDILLILVLTLINAIFAMSEMAVSASRKSLLNAMAQEGDKGAKAAVALMDNPTHFLSTVQVGITSIGMLNGIVGEAAFSGKLSLYLQSLGLRVGVSDVVSTAFVIIVITFISILLGELVPKRIGQMYPETVAKWVARPMQGVAKATLPFVQLLSFCTMKVLKLLKIDNSAVRTVTQQEISASLEEGLEAGVIESQEHQMVQNVFRLDERSLTSLMLPKTDIDWLDAATTVSESLERISKTGTHATHSWYPVCRGSLDEVVGVISVARLLELQEQGSDSIGKHTQAATFVPETLSGLELLEQFKERVTRMVFIVDEYGVVQGLITPLDLLEAITGELKPTTTDKAWAYLREDGSWLLDGLMPIDELKSQLKIKYLPDEERDLYNTLAGLLMFETGTLPSVGHKIQIENWLFEVIDLDGRRIDKVLAMYHETEHESSESLPT